MDVSLYVVTVSEWLCTSAAASVMTPGRKKNEESERENTGDLLDAVTPKDAVEELVMNDTAKTDKTVNDKVVEKSKKVSTKKQKAVKKTASTKKKTAAKKKATTKKNSTPTSALDS